MRGVVALLMLVPLLAGCSDQAADPASAGPVAEPDGEAAAAPADDGGSEAAASDQPVEPMTLTLPFKFTVAGDLLAAGFILPLDDGRLTVVDVPAGYTKAEVTAEWECTTGPVCGLDLQLRRGDPGDVMASGTSPQSFTAEVKSGESNLWAFPSGDGAVVAQLEGTYTVVLT